ncbi:hypothetical protein AB0F13_20245 [Streptomyces sp. NPDC026206]|uniref:hypothetical protein n=1 Tax=Streptomyces sp. NPDC026206 TaxID=3157089 RepID=UPI0033E15604
MDASPHPREKGGKATGPSPVARGKTGGKSPDLRRNGTSFKVAIPAADVNDVTQILALVDGILPVAGKPIVPKSTRHPARRQGL